LPVRQHALDGTQWQPTCARVSALTSACRPNQPEPTVGQSTYHAPGVPHGSEAVRFLASRSEAVPVCDQLQARPCSGEPDAILLRFPGHNRPPKSRVRTMKCVGLTKGCWLALTASTPLQFVVSCSSSFDQRYRCTGSRSSDADRPGRREVLQQLTNAGRSDAQSHGEPFLPDPKWTLHPSQHFE
jgi:hypothetical protein